MPSSETGPDRLWGPPSSRGPTAAPLLPGTSSTRLGGPRRPLGSTPPAVQPPRPCASTGLRTPCLSPGAPSPHLALETTPGAEPTLGSAPALRNILQEGGRGVAWLIPRGQAPMPPGTGLAVLETPEMGQCSV
ncbi:TPA: hypothetical protein BOS_16947 [Bos taurus]|nr:TPA: hypothetical protein BOS_16947 [Bos taurus]